MVTKALLFPCVSALLHQTVNVVARLPAPEAQHPHATERRKSSEEAKGTLTHGKQKSKKKDLFFQSLKKGPKYLPDKLRLKYLHSDRSTIKPRKKCVEKRCTWTVTPLFNFSIFFQSRRCCMLLYTHICLCIEIRSRTMLHYSDTQFSPDSSFPSPLLSSFAGSQ